MTDRPKPLLEAVNVHRVFDLRQGLFRPKKTIHAVNDVSLRIETGDIVGLVGESGSGKSTLARILLGLMPPTSGEVLFHGKPLSGFDKRAISSEIQIVFQDPFSSLNPRKTIESIISLPLRVHGIGNAETQKRRVAEIMDLVGLPERVCASLPNQLSGGQRQRVAIARALITNPKLVICDEPTSALDVSIQSQILNLLQRLQRQLDLTYVIVSHNLAVVEHMANKVAVMYRGAIVEEADTDALFAAPKHPYTQMLLASVLTPDPRLGLPDPSLRYPPPEAR
jgi:peptide/nickel transport system ATP-binding protein